MKLNITGRQLEITDTLRESIQRRAEKFSRFFNRVTSVDAITEKRGGHTFFCEYVVHADGHRPFVSTEKHDNLYAAGAAPADLRDGLLSAIRQRETQGSTGFGKGIAVPHVRHPGLNRIAAAVGTAPEGLDFSALDGQPVSLIILMMSPADDNAGHINAMEALFNNLNESTFRDQLRAADSSAALDAVLEAADARTRA